MSSRTREEIAAAALALVDAEGLEALSMRRLAARLDMGAMSLYHYVESKQDLLRLVEEAVVGELLVPEEEFAQDDWRTAVAQIARRSRDLFVAHPWIITVGMADDDPGDEPAGFDAHVDQSRRAVASLGLDEATRDELLFVVDDYVMGYALRTATGWRDELPDGLDDRFERGLSWLLDGVAAEPGVSPARRPAPRRGRAA